VKNKSLVRVMNRSPKEIAHSAYSACVMEASAEKPGNVTPTKGFDDLDYADFVKAAERLEPFIERAARDGEKTGICKPEICKLIYEATSTEKNVNFGIIIMFMPLAAARGGSTKKLLESLTPDDTKLLVKAMQRGKLGSMELKDKKLSKYDIFSKEIFKTIDDEGITPLALMKLAQSHDTLAKEWVEDYTISRAISKRIDADSHTIVNEYLRTLAEYPDTLIARKAGLEKAREVSQMAKWVLSGNLSITEFDQFLRSDGNKLNPGTTADLIATGLFLKLMSA